MGILLDGCWMLHHDIGVAAKKDVVLLALTPVQPLSSPDNPVAPAVCP
jgi:hypothetical protein